MLPPVSVPAKYYRWLQISHSIQTLKFTQLCLLEPLSGTSPTRNFFKISCNFETTVWYIRGLLHANAGTQCVKRIAYTTLTYIKYLLYHH